MLLLLSIYARGTRTAFSCGGVLLPAPSVRDELEKLSRRNNEALILVSPVSLAQDSNDLALVIYARTSRLTAQGLQKMGILIESRKL